MAFSCFIKSVIAKSANREMKDAKNRVVFIAQQHWEQYTFEYHCAEWKVTQCFVTVHRVLPKEESLQPDLLETAECDTFCYVTGKAVTPIILKTVVEHIPTNKNQHKLDKEN